MKIIFIRNLYSLEDRRVVYRKKNGIKDETFKNINLFLGTTGVYYYKRMFRVTWIEYVSNEEDLISGSLYISPSCMYCNLTWSAYSNVRYLFLSIIIVLYPLCIVNLASCR